MDLFDMQEGFSSLTEGLSRIVCPCMVIGVQTDILFPVRQQRDLAESLQNAGKSLIFHKYVRKYMIINIQALLEMSMIN